KLGCRSTDLNKEFSESKFVSDLLSNLSNKQDRIFLISFTSFGLRLQNDKIVNIGPGSRLVEKYDNKIEQVRLFKKLKLPVNITEVYKDINALKKAIIEFPSFISPAFTSGGAENAIIFSEKDLNIFFEKLRIINLDKEFFVARYIENIQCSPNSIGIICGKNDTRVLILTDQLIRGVKHTGNIYPSMASDENKKEMIGITKKIGDYLSELGFRGLFGCDFIIDETGKVYVVELNPRRQSCYLITQLMSKQIDLLEVELKIFMGEEIPKFSYDNIQCDYTWIHSKLKQHQEYQKITKEFKLNNEQTPFNKLGGVFSCSYFPADYLLNDCNYYGYYVSSGSNYDELLKKAQKEIENILLTTLKDV
ncbi:pyruvate carboxylase, partial [sediment metagenome]